VPALADARVLRSWAGTLDNTPDHKPLVGSVEGLPGYVIAAGFSGHGFCLGPVIGESVADLVLGRPPQVDLSDLAPARFEVLA
jgi:glycine/D-amino acid oxidase-like deaminating enzyme